MYSTRPRVSRDRNVPRKSLRRRLIVLTLGVLAPVWLALALGAYVFMLREVDKLFDQQLEHVAATLFTLDLAHIKAAVDAPGFHSFDDEDPFVVYVWSSDGTQLFRSEFAPRLPYSHDAPRFQTLGTPEGRWRVMRVKDPDSGNWLVVARPSHERTVLARDLAASLAVPWFVSLVLMVALVWLAVGRGLAPLYDLSRQVAGRKPDDLSPVAAVATPREAQPLVDEINLLLARVDAALEQERRFTADASHELRTPLAAIRAQVEVAVGEDDAVARQHALGQALTGVVAASRLIDQLLTLARLDHLDAVPDAGRCDLLQLAREELVDCTRVALLKDIELSLDGETCQLHGSPGLLRLALRNLFDNAIAHTPRGGTVTVRLSREGDEICLSVRDSGEGVPEGLLERLGERFFRAGESRPGSGLGLSILRRIASLHGARVRFTSPGGLQVGVYFPLAMAQAIYTVQG
ncbi:two-component sensor histidine kinase [Chitinimonas arctica]|uniref:histidine kinase n=1 Tax=Chitinimonas arctica TaxID=2594795 RepID=A0A516SKN8_9NEIS|nr:ATP-binding protein [Chitinimonas arctica]QDQ28714.1 two-component sensor histidine kinase [Chitinimonas arctica]